MLETSARSRPVAFGNCQDQESTAIKDADRWVVRGDAWAAFMPYCCVYRQITAWMTRAWPGVPLAPAAYRP
jgi:hypothetical protein